MEDLVLGGSGAAMEARDVHQDTFVETLRAAAEEFDAKRKMAKAERAAGSRRLNTCVYCDERCVARATASGYASAKDYFDVTIGEMNRIVQSGLDEGMSFELTFVLLPYTVTEMSWFFDYSATTSEELLAGIYHDGGLNAAFTSMAEEFTPGRMLGGCEAEFDVLSGACAVGSVGCPSGKCIMAATVDGTAWSECSKAYYAMYSCLVEVMPQYYSDECTLDRK